MTALAEPLWTKPARTASRNSERPVCAICGDTMIAAEASVLMADDRIGYLWTCDTCGYGFVTQHESMAPRLQPSS